MHMYIYIYDMTTHCFALNLVEIYPVVPEI